MRARAALEVIEQLEGVGLDLVEQAPATGFRENPHACP